MSKEKQIEELTNELVFTSNYGTYNAVANYLVNKGYRKQIEVAREIFEEIEKYSEVAHWNGLLANPVLCIGVGTLAELKKKYTEENK